MTFVYFDVLAMLARQGHLPVNFRAAHTVTPAQFRARLSRKGESGYPELFRSRK